MIHLIVSIIVATACAIMGLITGHLIEQRETKTVVRILGMFLYTAQRKGVDVDKLIEETQALAEQKGITFKIKGGSKNDQE